MLFLAAYAAARRRVRAAPEFACLMLASSLYAFCNGLELSQSTLDGMLAVIRIEYLGIVAVWTNGLHHLYYSRIWLRTDGPFPASFGFDRGPLYYLSIVYTESFLAAGNAVLIARALRAPPFVRRQAIALAVASLGPWLGSLGYMMGWVPWGLDPIPFCMALVDSLSAFALFSLGFLELVPAARDRAIESSKDGFLVVDGQGRIVDSNEAAGLLLGEWARREGDPLDRLLLPRPRRAPGQGGQGIVIREGRPFSAAIFDIDHFKAVNDGFGHAAGDLALREFASRLSLSVREIDTLSLADGVLAMRASAGIYSALPVKGDCLDSFLAEADAALYEAKAAGRDRAVQRVRR